MACRARRGPRRLQNRMLASQWVDVQDAEQDISRWRKRVTGEGLVHKGDKGKFYQNWRAAPVQWKWLPFPSFHDNCSALVPQGTKVCLKWINLLRWDENSYAKIHIALKCTSLPMPHSWQKWMNLIKSLHFNSRIQELLGREEQVKQRHEETLRHSECGTICTTQLVYLVMVI